MNKLEDFTDGSEWIYGGMKLKFHSFRKDGTPLFTCDEKFFFNTDENGAFGLVGLWKEFTKVQKDNNP